MINFSGGRQLLRKLSGVAGNSPADLDLRADLAGLLIISFVASYENAIKKILITYADNHNDKFSFFVEKQFDKLNSKINIHDLKGYAKKFDEILEQKFENELTRVKSRLMENQIETWYEQILQWRHAFAHTGQRSTTIEEVFKAHQFAKYVIFAFHKAFSEATPPKIVLADRIFNEFLTIKDTGQSRLEDTIYIATHATDHEGLINRAKLLGIELSKLFTKIKKQRRSLDFYGMRNSLHISKTHTSELQTIHDTIYLSF
jgi:hypothetical protein